MATLGIDGLASGLDTTSIIDSLMQAEAVPQTLLKTKATTTQSFVSALQTLNSTIASLATKATAAAKNTSLATFTATSSSDAATAVAATGSSATKPGSVDFTVGRIAQTQVGVTAAMSSWSDPDGSSTPALTLVSSTGARTQVTAASTSLDDVVSAINGAGAGVTASKIAVGTDANGAALYRLQLAGTATGQAAAFTVYRGTSADVDAGTASDVLKESGAATVRQAQDAAVSLWSGTAAEQTVTSATNTFSGLMAGVSITVAKASSDPVTVTVAQDPAAATAVASGLVTSMNSVLSYYASSTAVSSSTSTTGAVTTTAGALTGDGTSRDAVQALTSAMSAPVNGHSPSEMGISITRDGTFTFDSDAFGAALAKDPAGVQATLSAISSRIQTAATAVSDPYTGTLSSAVAGQQSVVKDLNDQIASWDDRLADRRQTLVNQFTALETSLSTLKSQSSWLTSQLASL